MIKYINLFFAYSMLGYLCEVVFCSIIDKKFRHARGFLIGPYLPIYGTAATILYFFTENISNNLFITILVILLVAGALEYFTSYILEKIFKIRWWNYSDRPFNINGRICLENMIMFLILGLIVTYFINPHIFNIINIIPSNFLIFIDIFLIIVFIMDIILTIIALCKIDKKDYQKLEDSTYKIKQEIFKFLKLK
ncbi:MAG: putative ABC transporter permease [Bacilli bacterium]